MPKQFKTYTRFEGGLNTKTNARSIQDNELAQANNVIIDEFGMVKSCGKAVANTGGGTNYTAPSLGGAQQAGYGLFQAVMDYKIDGTNSPTVFTFLADPSSATKIDIAEDETPFSQSGAFDADEIDLNVTSAVSGTSNGAAVYDIADGAVRISDANFGAANTTKIYKFVKRKMWLDSSGNQLNIDGSNPLTISEYVSTFSGLYKPFENPFIVAASVTGYPTAGGLARTGDITQSGTLSSSSTVNANPGAGIGSDHEASLDTTNFTLVNLEDSTFHNIRSANSSGVLSVATTVSTSAGDDNYILAPKAGLGFNIEVTQPGAGTMTAGTYEFAQTFIYDETQESLPSEMKGTITIGSSKYLQIRVIAHNGYNKRITGGRIYMRDSTIKGEWELVADINLTYGCKTSLEGDYTGWSYPVYSSGTFQLGVFVCSVNIAANNVDTFETLNGYSSSVLNNHIATSSASGYKTSAISNRRKFIANVKMEDTTGTAVHQPDRLMYSDINKFDTILPTNFIDIGVNDGEEFVKLEAFADRLLAFKNRTLYIINIGGGSDTQWFLESSHQNMGVPFHAATVKTAFGVCWANKNGLYIYDGSRISNLQTKILESEWESFIGSDTMVGYEPTHKHLVVIRSASDTGSYNGDAYVYSFITKSFTFVEDLVADNVKSNPITDIYNKMTMAVSTNSVVSYDGEPDAGTTFDIKLKDDDFGLPNTVKKIYGVTVEYASDNDNSNGIKYFYTNDSGTKQGTANAGDLADTDNDLDVNRVTFGTPLLASSFQVQLDMDGNSVQKVNNVAVEYRPIYKRVT